MDLKQYQRKAQGTDRVPLTGHENRDREARLVPLLGLAGEVGTLLAGYKKFLRDGEAYELFTDNVGEEVGDLLWYLANVAEKWGLSLDELAAANLTKTTDRWPTPGKAVPKRKPADLFDHQVLRAQRLPRTFTVDIYPVGRDRGPEERIEVRYLGKAVGSRLGDNTYDASGYRFHDIFHLANAAILGWSPVARAQLFGCKRRGDEIVNEVEDGGRAIVIEEGMVAFLFEHARNPVLLTHRQDWCGAVGWTRLSSVIEVLVTALRSSSSGPEARGKLSPASDQPLRADLRRWLTMTGVLESPLVRGRDIPRL